MKNIVVVTLNGGDPLFAFQREENFDNSGLEDQIREFAAKNNIVGRIRFYLVPLNEICLLLDESEFWSFNV